jgi:hypothetical protein
VPNKNQSGPTFTVQTRSHTFNTENGKMKEQTALASMLPNPRLSTPTPRLV